MTMKMDIQLDETSLKLFETAMNKLAIGCVDKGLKAMGKPIEIRMSQIAPDSQQPTKYSSGQDKEPSRKKWSKKFKSNASWQVRSADGMGVKVIRTAAGGVVKVGATSKKGNKQNFNANVSGKGRKEVFWGVVQSTRYKPTVNWRQKAYDETLSQQQSEFQTAIVKAMKEAGLG